MSPPGDQEKILQEAAAKALGKGLEAVSKAGVKILQSGQPQKPTPSQPCTPPLAKVIVRKPKGDPDIIWVCYGKERLPPGRAAGQFAGYRTLYHALAEATMCRSAPAVLYDVSGRFRVFETSQPRRRLKAQSVQAVYRTPNEPRKGGPFFSGLRMVDLEMPNDPRPWNDQWVKANNYERFELMRQILGLKANEVASTSLSRDWDPNRINYDTIISLPGLTTFVEPSDAPGNYRQAELVFDKKSTLPQTGFAIGNVALTEVSPYPALATIVHEATHQDHNNFTIAILRAWRASKSNDFDKWLKNQHNQRSRIDGRLIDQEAFQVVAEKRNKGSATTQTIAYLEGFMSVFHHPDFPLKGDALRLHFEQLDVLDDKGYWKNVHIGLKQELKRRLSVYFSGLDSGHQQAPRQHIQSLQNPGQFYKDLQQTLK
jgi:hypothetical protein